MKKALIALAVILGIALIGGIAYFLYPLIASNQSSNTIQFEKFGLAVMPGAQFRTSVGELGETQLPATFSEDDLSPEERVVASLIRDRNKLIEENQALKLKLEAADIKIQNLEEYRDKNERYAPEQFDVELKRVLADLEAHLRALPETERYSDLMVQLMAIAGQQEYINVVRSNDLIMDEARKSIILQRYLPSYSFCVGNALSVAANNSRELRSIANWLLEPELSPLPADLKADLDVVLPPCQLSFREALGNVLQAAVTR